jgi:hypothetical protein
MTTEPAAPTTPAPSGGARRRKIVIGLVLAALGLGVALWVFWPSIAWSIWIRGADKKEYQGYLIAEQDPDLVPKIAAGVRDDSLAPSTRVALVRILHTKSRYQVIDDLLQNGDLSTRTVVLQAEMRQDYFEKTLVVDPRFRVKETLVEWLRRPRDGTRVDAVALSERPALQSPETRDALRAIVAKPYEEGPSAGRVRSAAARQLGALLDCESAPALVAMAREDPEPPARMAGLQTVAALAMKEGGCQDRVPLTEVKTLVFEAIAAPGREEDVRPLQMAALQILDAKPEWAKEAAERIRAILASDGYGGKRRIALEVLVKIEDAKTIEEFPKYFHDPDDHVRSSAVQLAFGGKANRGTLSYEGCLIGIVRDERKNGAAFQRAVEKLRMIAPSWSAIGFPPEYDAMGPNVTVVQSVLRGLLASDAAEGATRDGVVSAMWHVLATREKLTADQEKTMRAARDAFWQQARGGNAKGAKAVLDALGSDVSNPVLWTYERGWLLSRGA